MELNTLLSGGIILSLITALAYSLKSVPALIYNKIKKRLIYRVNIYDYQEFFSVFEKWLYKEKKSSFRNVEARVITIKRKRILVFKQEENLMCLKVSGITIWINKDKEKVDGAKESVNTYLHKYSIVSLIRNKDKVDELLKYILAEYSNSKLPQYVDVYSHSQWGETALANSIRVKKLSEIYLESGKIEYLTQDLEEFKNRKEWYNTRSIPYKRGYLFYGPPGTGKTSTALALAEYLGYNVLTISLSAMRGEDYLFKLFRDVDDSTVVIIEDVDCYFNGRDIVSDKKDLSFSGFLNCLDGAAYKEGLIVVITTNHLEKLDPALLRAGRMDVKLHLGLADSEIINSYLSTFYSLESKEPFPGELSMSEVQEICIKNSEDYGKAVYNILRKIDKKSKVLK